MNAYKKIKEARELEGLKQSEMADILGISQNNISKLESGQAKFIPNSYIEFLASKGYDINTLFNDDLPLQKLNYQFHSLMESRPMYMRAPDEPLLNMLKRSLSFQRKEQVTDLFDRFNENGQTKVDLFELQIIAHWERHYLAEFQQVQRDIKELRDQLSQISKQNNHGQSS